MKTLKENTGIFPTKTLPFSLIREKKYKPTPFLFPKYCL